MVSLLKPSFTKRKSNFTYAETDLLLEELEQNKDLLSTAAGIAKHHKRAMWEDITAKINNIGEGDERTLEEVRKKWSDMQCLAKRKYCKGKQELNEFEVRTLALRSESEKWAIGSYFEDAEDSNFEFDTLSEADIQIKQEKTDYELDHPPVHFDGVREQYEIHDQEQVNEYPETPIAFDPMSRKRKSNFSVLERDTLLEEVKRKRSIIMSKSNDMCTHEKKRLAWEDITAKVNDKGRGNYRTVEEVRKKWNDMQSLARRKKRRGVSMSRFYYEEGNDGTAEEVMDVDENEEASTSVEGTEDGNSIDDSDIIERVMASAYAEEVERDEVDLLEEDGMTAVGYDSNDSNGSEWTPSSRRKHSLSGKPRKGNFSIAETSVLLDEIYKRRKIVFSPNLDRRSAEKKRREWQNIAQFVSEICNKERRTLNEVRKKWSDLYTRASKFKAKKEVTDPEEEGPQSEIDKINRRVLFIMQQKDEDQRKRDDAFETSMFGREADEEESSNKNKRIKPDNDNAASDEVNKAIAVKNLPGQKKSKMFTAVADQKDPPSTQTTDDSVLVIENVSTIDEKVFSSMNPNQVSPEKNDIYDNKSTCQRSLLKPNQFSQLTEAETDTKVTHPEHFIIRKRKGKFSSRETSFLLDEVRKNKSLLLSKLTATAINEKKKLIWQEITDKVNCLRTGVPRSSEEVKKKWYDLQCNAKKKRALQESLLERMKISSGEIAINEDCEKSALPQFFRSHSKLLSLLGSAGLTSDPDKSDILADGEDSTEAEDVNDESDEKLTTEDNSNSNDDGRVNHISISTDRIRDNIKSAPNILTNTDWKVLEITDGGLSEIANYAAIDHNYEVRLDRHSSVQEAVSTSGTQHGLKITSVVSQAEISNPRKPELNKNESEDTASTLSHITADVAHQRLSVEKKRLTVEKQRLKVEQEKLRLLRRLVKLEEEKVMMRKEEKKKFQGKELRTKATGYFKLEKETSAGGGVKCEGGKKSAEIKGETSEERTCEREELDEGETGKEEEKNEERKYEGEDKTEEEQGEEKNEEKYEEEEKSMAMEYLQCD